MRFLMAYLLVLSCGTPSTVPNKEILVGDYDGTFQILESDGTCDFLTKAIGGHLSFDETGDMKSPLPGVDCATSYPLHIICKGYGSILEASGTIYHQDAYGYGQASGNLSGCKYARFHFFLTPKT